MNAEIPLFPLGTVLFPQGLLPLRIFETRYTDMVRRCMRDAVPFGVVLIQRGGEVGPVSSIASIGTTARIFDFSTLEDGLLGIQCRGEQRFQVLRSWRQDDGLNLAEVEYLEPWAAEPAPIEAQPLVALLRTHWSEFAAHFNDDEPSFDDATWVCARLAQVLPLPPPLRQRLLESDSASIALQVLSTLVKPEQQNA